MLRSTWGPADSWAAQRTPALSQTLFIVNISKMRPVITAPRSQKKWKKKRRKKKTSQSAQCHILPSCCQKKARTQCIMGAWWKKKRELSFFSPKNVLERHRKWQMSGVFYVLVYWFICSPFSRVNFSMRGHCGKRGSVEKIKRSAPDMGLFHKIYGFRCTSVKPMGLFLVSR